MEFVLTVIIGFLFFIGFFFSIGMIRSLLSFIITSIIALSLGILCGIINMHILPYNKNVLDTYNRYKQILDNKIEIPICIEKIDEGIFREGKCLNSIIIKNNEQLISVINLLYKTDIEEQLKIYKEYNKQNNIK